MAANSDPHSPMNPLADLVGETDIYLLDQVMRGRIARGMRILDAGCGGGRNLHYFLRNGFHVCGVDQNAGSVQAAVAFARDLAPHISEASFRVEKVTNLSAPDGSFDVVVCIAVLHFAADVAEFHAMVDELWRVIRPGGMLFTRLASTTGIESAVEHKQGRWFHLPDGTDRFLVDEAMLLDTTSALGGTLLDPLKTVNVQRKRAMTTWCVRKNG